jgi:hypothetical protein
MIETLLNCAQVDLLKSVRASLYFKRFSDQATKTFSSGYINITTHGETHCGTNNLILILIIVINNRDSLVLFGGLHFPVLLRASWLLGRGTGILTIIRITWLLCIVLGALLVEVIFLLFLVVVFFSILGLGALGLLLRSYGALEGNNKNWSA